jgi:hypothetical protein
MYVQFSCRFRITCLELPGHPDRDVLSDPRGWPREFCH